MDIFSFVTMVGGLAMFLYGMEIMGDGLKKSSGETLRRILQTLTKNTFTGVLTGMLVTGIIQASSATIVLTVGLMVAGLLTLRQTASIVMGANIGTTVTGQIIRLMDLEANGNAIINLFKPSTLAPLALIAGVVLLMFSKRLGKKGIAEIMVGFGVLFSGLLIMTEAVSPLAESEFFLTVITKLSVMPLLGIISGIVITVIVQSSSAVVGMLQALSSTGVLTFDLIYPLIMGINIGTCIVTAVLCSIDSSRDAKRVAVIHILFNCIGTVIFMAAMTALNRMGLFGSLWGKTVNSGDIANFQTLFNLITAALLMPFTDALVKASEILIRHDAAEQERAQEAGLLDKKLLVSPGLAMAEAGAALSKMGRLALENLRMSMKQLSSYEPSVSAVISDREDRLDNFADRSDHFLISLAHLLVTDEHSAHMNLLMQAVPDFERIGDYATNIDELAQRLNNSKVCLSERARKELEILCEAVDEIVTITVDAFTRDDNEAAMQVEPLEEVIDDMVVTLRDSHTERLRCGVCTVNAGLVFIEVLTYMERAADQCSSIALLMLARDNEEIRGNHHAYLRNLHSQGNEFYCAELERRREQYLSRLKCS
ncbi:MAG TPA: Na/Pi cotransporter [Clostridiales bacterium]|nr:Na/Pi cotransporter [Clostridiales bacterium]HBR08772.1 Na/Pi cotransporter [Clostridiales bacterium]